VVRGYYERLLGRFAAREKPGGKGPGPHADEAAPGTGAEGTGNGIEQGAAREYVEKLQKAFLEGSNAAGAKGGN
jgi:hypothetical protein